MRKLACAVLLLCPVPALADATAEDLGREIFQDICAACHGETAATGIAGDIRGADLSTVTRALRGFEAMPTFDFTDEEQVALVAYLAALEGS